ncbi:MAG: ATP-binding protein [Nocardioidaceae bacterium]|nr:ATP-binding protein [Nocardioidaceae bacterium]
MTGREWGRLALPPLLTSARAARRFVVGILTQAGLDDLADDAELAVNEIVTNAILHAGTPLSVTVAPVGSGVRIAVADGSARLPETPESGDRALSGRGLRLVAMVAGDWGVLSHDGGKTVWFELGR